MSEPLCYCGHVEDEHEDGFFRACTVEGCECIAFEQVHVDEDEE